MTNSVNSDDPFLEFDWSTQDGQYQGLDASRSKPLIKKKAELPDNQFPIFVDNSRPGRTKRPYYENAMSKKPQHLCGILQSFAIVQFGYAAFTFLIWAYSITILGVSGLNAAFYLTFISVCLISGWKIQKFEIFGISLAWASTTLLGISTFYYSYLALEIKEAFPNAIQVITFLYIMCIVSLVQALASIAFLKNGETKQNIHSYFR